MRLGKHDEVFAPTDTAGPDPDPEQATDDLSRLTKAAETGLEYAQYALGKLYLTREDVPKNMRAALRWLQCSAELGN